MPISGSQVAQLFALSGVLRSATGRSNGVSVRMFVAINGVQYAAGRLVDANKVVDGSLSIADILNETPNTAAFAMMGFEPVEGSDVVMTIGSINNADRLYAGLILNRTHQYVDTPASWTAGVNVIDYTWHLQRRKVSKIYTNLSATDIAKDLVTFAPGFTANNVAAGLPVIDTISFTDVDILSALTALAKRIGGYCDVDYHRDVKVFLTDASVTNPTDLTAALASLSEFTYTKDLSQYITRVRVEGGGVNALAALAVGETIIPVETIAWYSALGGKVKSGSQHIAYTGVFAGGNGSLVGPGATPSAAPALALVAGVGLGTGVYQYAYTDVTPSGESLPSPLGSITTGTVGTFLAAPGAPTIAVLGSGSGGMVSGATYRWRVTFVTAVGETDGGTPSAGFNPANGSADVQNVPIGGAGVTDRKLYRTLANGSTYFLLGAMGNNTGTAFADVFGDSAISGNATVPTTNTAQTGTTAALQVTVSGIALGAAPTTSRKVYRTAVGGTQLKLLATIADNVTTAIATDTLADGSLGVNAPTADTSGLTQPSGQVNAGSTTLLTASAAPFSATGGWALLPGGQVVRYTGIAGNTLTGIPATGPGALLATAVYGGQVVAAPALIGVPASGAGSIVYPILQGDQINILVTVDNVTAQAALAALLDPTGTLGDDGVVEDFLQDGTIGITEATARANAELALRATVLVSIGYKTRDKNTRAGRTIRVNLGAPTNIVATFQIQNVTIDTFNPALLPTYTVVASSSRFSLEDLLRLARGTP